MLTIPAEIRQSPIHHFGLYALAPVAKGCIVWELVPELDLVFGPELVERTPEPARTKLLHYSFWNSRLERYVLCWDDARFINHSDDPNTDGRRAVRAIAAGEEITYAYGRRDLTFQPRRRLPAEAVPRMIALLDDSDPSLRLFAAKSLSCAGSGAAPAVNALERAAASERGLTRYYAVKTLAKLGAAAAAARPVLVTAATDPDERVRAYAAKALAAIDAAAGQAR